MASKMTAQHVLRLRDELSRVDGEIRALQGRREGILMAISVMNDEPAHAGAQEPVQGVRRPRVGQKDTILRLLADTGDRGANAVDLVDLAHAQGIILDRNSVSSLLSRFKRDGIVEHDGKKYRIPRPFPREVKDVA